MKTTLDLPDDLLLEAKAIAVRRKTTLKAIIEHALRREIRPASDLENPDPEKYELGPFGILSLKKRGQGMTADQVQHLIDHEYDEEDARVIDLATGKP
ncbi:MAG: hypothetical protein SNJ84_03795 [Verrucomicrobiia bacterium]